MKLYVKAKIKKSPPKKDPEIIIKFATIDGIDIWYNKINAIYSFTLPDGRVFKTLTDVGSKRIIRNLVPKEKKGK